MPPRITPILLAVAVLGSGVGCEFSRTRSDMDLIPPVEYREPRRTLALDSPALRRATAAAPYEAGLPWYAARNDARPATYSGAPSATFERSFTYTIDRQSHHGGRIRDHYNSTTYHEQVTELYR